MSASVQILQTAGSDRQVWMDYYGRLDQRGIYHSPDYISILEKHYNDKAELFIYEENGSFIYYPYFRRKLDKIPLSDKCDLDLAELYDIASSWYYGGPIVSSCEVKRATDCLLIENFISCFHDYCRDTRIVSEFIRFDPNIKNYEYFQNHLPVKFNRETIYVDLTQSEGEIWAQYTGRCRTAIRKGKTYPIQIKAVNSDDFLDHFSEIYHNEMIRKSAPSHYLFPKKFFHNLFATLKDRAMLFIVMHDQIPVGGSICLIEPSGVAYDYLTATLSDYWKFQINNILMHEVILWCKKAGAKIYDFHGGRKSVAFFKTAFSSLCRHFHVAEVIHDNELYGLLTECKRQSFGNDSSNFFPEYRNKNTN